MRPSNYYRPKSIEEALQLLSQPDTAVLAGGTKLLADDVAASSVVDLQALGLNQIRFDENYLYLGAMVRLVDWAAFLAANDAPDSPAQLLQKAIRQSGPNTYRNAATAGGSVSARLPDSELLAALLVLEAELLSQSPEANWLSLVDYMAVAERPNGLITEIRLPWEAGWGSSERVARTPADYPIVSVTVWQPTGQPPRLAATGIDELPVRLAAAERTLSENQSEAAIQKAAAASAAQANHPGDFRGSSQYRAEMTAVLTKRVLNKRVFKHH